MFFSCSILAKYAAANKRYNFILCLFLKVNTNPGLGCDDFSNVDEQVKKPMLHEMFTLLGLPDCRDFMKRRSSSVSVPSSADSSEKTCWGESEDEYLLEQIVNSGRGIKQMRCMCCYAYSHLHFFLTFIPKRLHVPFETTLYLRCVLACKCEHVFLRTRQPNFFPLNVT